MNRALLRSQKDRRALAVVALHADLGGALHREAIALLRPLKALTPEIGALQDEGRIGLHSIKAAPVAKWMHE